MIILAAIVTLIVVHAIHMIAEHRLLHSPERWSWEILYSATYHLRYILIVVIVMLGLAHCFS